MTPDFKTIHEFNDYFKDEETCYKYLEDLFWAGVPACPHCGSIKTPYKVASRLKLKGIPSYRCSESQCKLPFTVRTGSIFENSQVPLRKWLQAGYEMTIAKKGISSVELATRIGVSQKTAWFMNHRLRGALGVTTPELLTGLVEVDETYVGGKLKNKHKSVRKANAENKSLASAGNKTGVMVLKSRGGETRTLVLDGDKTLKQIIKENVHTSSVLITDGYNPYITVGREYSQHEIIDHKANEFARGIYHTNNIFTKGIVFLW